MYDDEYNFTTDNERGESSASYNVPAPVKKKKGGFGRKVISLVLSGLLFGASAAGAFAGVNKLIGRDTRPAESGQVTQQTQQQDQSGQTPSSVVSYASNSGKTAQTLNVVDIAEGMMPAMVSITNISVSEVQSYFGMFGSGRTQTRESQSSGTGIIIGENDTELLIVTNNHVVEDASTLSVCFVDNEVCEASVKGTDPDNDLAVIAVKLENIKDETEAAIRIAPIGDSDSLKVGEQVVAIGNALGYGQSVTTGIVSALDRSIDTTDAIMIQTDAAINPGNSGGALLNMNGEVVGINSAKFSSTDIEGMGYAISITPALPIIEDLMNRTTREKVADEDAAYIGVSGEDVTASISLSYGIPQGIYITSLSSDSPLKEAGISLKSVITHFDGIRVTGISNLKNRLKYYAAGETVEITVQVPEGREYVEKTFEITLGSAAEHSSGTGQGGQSGYGYGYGQYGYGQYGRP